MTQSREKQGEGAKGGGGEASGTIWKRGALGAGPREGLMGRGGDGGRKGKTHIHLLLFVYYEMKIRHCLGLLEVLKSFWLVPGTPNPISPAPQRLKAVQGTREVWRKSCSACRKKPHHLHRYLYIHTSVCLFISIISLSFSSIFYLSKQDICSGLFLAAVTDFQWPAASENGDSI